MLLLLLRNSGGGGPTLQCITFKDGMMRQMPASAPYGNRLQFTGGMLSDAAGGTALVFDVLTAHIRQAIGGETVIEP